MIDQNNESIQGLKKRPIKENGYVHVARQNDYRDLIERTKTTILNNKKILKFESYVEWLENEVLYLAYKAEWKENQRKHTEERLLKTKEEKQYLTQCIEYIQDILIKKIDKKEVNE